MEQTYGVPKLGKKPWCIDESKNHKAGRHVNQAEREGLSQWAYWSAERDDFHTEEEAREEIRSFIEEEKAMME